MRHRLVDGRRIPEHSTGTLTKTVATTNEEAVTFVSNERAAMLA